MTGFQRAVGHMSDEAGTVVGPTISGDAPRGCSDRDVPELPGLDSAERFSYGGFKLLFPRTGNTSSSLWAGAVGGTTIVLPDVDTFRLEFTRAID